ncbi:MAG: ABC transporter ATP-binding protein [Clostridia bacterium]|nr:ABC transporter ATP-binding protein [Clostridia bacterium]
MVFGALFYILSKVLFTLVSFLISLIISSVQIANFNGVKQYAFLIIAFIFGFAIFEFIGHTFALSIKKQIKQKLEKNLAFAIFKAENEKDTSFISMLKNIDEVSDFSMLILPSIGYFFSLVFILSVLLYTNLLLFILTLILGIISVIFYIMLGKLNKKYATLSSSKETEKQLEFLNMIDGKSYAFDYSKESEVFSNFLGKSNEQGHFYRKEKNINLAQNIILNLIWYLGISFIIIYLIKLLKFDYITLNLFVICLPYLVSVANSFYNFSSLFLKLDLVNNSAINLASFFALNLQNEFYGLNTTNKILGTLEFINATYISGKNTLLDSVSFSAKKGDVLALEFGNKLSFTSFCGLIRRKLNLNKGTIMIDNIPASEFEKETYTNNLIFVSCPYFFENATILDSLKQTGISQNKIVSFLKETKILSEFKKQNISLNSSTSVLQENSDLAFLISCVRAYFSGAEIMVFSLNGISLTSRAELHINSLLKKMKKDRTIILASAFKINLYNSEYLKINALGKLIHQKSTKH